MQPKCGLTAVEVGEAEFLFVSQAHHVQLPYAVPFRTVAQPAAVGGGLRMVVERSLGSLSETLRFSVERHAKEPDIAFALGRKKARLPVEAPHRHIGAPAV